MTSHSSPIAGLVESPEKTDTPQHLAFYLFVLQQLAYPSSITGLFAMESGNDDAPVLIKQQQAQEAVKAVFRCGRCSDPCPA